MRYWRSIDIPNLSDISKDHNHNWSLEHLFVLKNNNLSKFYVSNTKPSNLYYSFNWDWFYLLLFSIYLTCKVKCVILMDGYVYQTNFYQETLILITLKSQHYVWLDFKRFQTFCQNTLDDITNPWTVYKSSNISAEKWVHLLFEWYSTGPFLNNCRLNQIRINNVLLNQIFDLCTASQTHKSERANRVCSWNLSRSTILIYHPIQRPWVLIWAPSKLTVP